MVKARGLLDQLQMTLTASKLVTIVDGRGDDDDGFRVGGYISAARESDSEDFPVVRLQTVIQPGCEVEDLPIVSGIIYSHVEEAPDGNEVILELRWRPPGRSPERLTGLDQDEVCNLTLEGDDVPTSRVYLGNIERERSPMTEVENEEEHRRSLVVEDEEKQSRSRNQDSATPDISRFSPRDQASESEEEMKSDRQAKGRV